MRVARVLVAATLAVGLGGCFSNKQVVSTEKSLAKALISDEQEAQLGLAFKNELNKQGVRQIEDPDVEAYVNGIGAKIFPLAEKDRKDQKFHVHIIADDDMVNAFATPGGHLYVTTGLLLTADDEAEVAGVLAHEAGHVVARHSARQLVQMYGLQTVAGLALGENPGMLQQLAANMAATGVLLAHSRNDEFEADRYGVKYSAKAGYDPRGITRFFKKLKAKEGKSPKIMTWLSTHPATSERIARVDDLIHEKKLQSGARNQSRHDAIKQILSDKVKVRGTEPVH